MRLSVLLDFLALFDFAPFGKQPAAPYLRDGAALHEAVASSTGKAFSSLFHFEVTLRLPL